MYMYNRKQCMYMYKRCILHIHEQQYSHANLTLTYEVVLRILVPGAAITRAWSSADAVFAARKFEKPAAADPVSSTAVTAATLGHAAGR
jgi:hypothetical protein